MWLLVTIAVIGMIIMAFLFTPISSNGLSGPASSIVWGYGAIAISVLGLIFTMIGDKNRSKPLTPPPSVIEQFIYISPGFLMILILICIITVTSHYYIRINKGEVSKDYYKYNSLAILTISTQYFLLVYYLLDNTRDEFHIAAYLNFGFFTCNILIIGMLLIIAKYYTTDG